MTRARWEAQAKVKTRPPSTPCADMRIPGDLVGNNDDFKMQGYCAQYARALRYLKIAEAPSADREVKQDDLVTFFLHCWHLKDHIRKDSRIPGEVSARIVNAAHEDRALKICRQIANGMKHFTAYPLRMEARNDLIAVTGGKNPGTTVYPKITLEGGSERRAVDVARDAMNAWTRILQAEGVPLQ